MRTGSGSVTSGSTTQAEMRSLRRAYRLLVTHHVGMAGGDEVAEESLPPPGDSSCGHGSGRREGDAVLVREEVRTSDTSGRCGPQLQELANLHGRGDAV